MNSPTRRRFLEKRKLTRAHRKRREGMVPCRGKIVQRGERVACSMPLFPRRQDIDSVITCHKCGTGHIKSATGWITFKEDAMKKGKLE